MPWLRSHNASNAMRGWCKRKIAKAASVAAYFISAGASAKRVGTVGLEGGRGHRGAFRDRIDSIQLNRKRGVDRRLVCVQSWAFACLRKKLLGWIAGPKNGTYQGPTPFER
jgi:hypothetical protein